MRQIKDLNLIGLQARQGLLEPSLQVLGFVAAIVWDKPRGDAEPFGGAEITQHLFAGSVAIVRACVELIVAKLQYGAKLFLKQVPAHRAGRSDGS
jgi:hypothetical protein